MAPVKGIYQVSFLFFIVKMLSFYFKDFIKKQVQFEVWQKKASTYFTASAIQWHHTDLLERKVDL